MCQYEHVRERKKNLFFTTQHIVAKQHVAEVHSTKLDAIFARLELATALSPPQHTSQPSTSYTTQILSQSGLLPRSLNTSRQTGTLGREPPALFSSLFCSKLSSKIEL